MRLGCISEVSQGLQVLTHCLLQTWHGSPPLGQAFINQVINLLTIKVIADPVLTKYLAVSGPTAIALHSSGKLEPSPVLAGSSSQFITVVFYLCSASLRISLWPRGRNAA